MKRQTDIARTTEIERREQKRYSKSARHTTKATKMGSTNSKWPSTKKFQSLLSYIFKST